MTKKPLPEGAVIALDFGLARTGAAVGNTISRTAEPLAILSTPTNAKRWAAVDELNRAWEPVAFVVGVPRHPDGAPSELTARCEKFARQVAARYGRPCFTVDERYSSVEVEHGREKIDDAAAAVILEQFFNDSTSMS